MSSLAVIALPLNIQITAEAENENKRLEVAPIEQRSQKCFNRIDFHESPRDETENSKASLKHCIVLTKPLLTPYKSTLAAQSLGLFPESPTVVAANKTPTYQSPIIRPKAPAPESQLKELLSLV